MAAPVPLLFSEALNVSRKWSKTVEKGISIRALQQRVARGTKSTKAPKIQFPEIVWE